MIYKEKIIEILNKLGACKTYKGYYYILSSIEFIHEHETNFLPITKVLYVDIAKQYNTSDKCVEKNIRKVIEHIWKQDNNISLISNIFGENNLSKRLSNAEFLTLLYDYILLDIEKEMILPLCRKEIQFICPLHSTTCEFCNHFIYESANKIQHIIIKKKEENYEQNII